MIPTCHVSRKLEVASRQTGTITRQTHRRPKLETRDGVGVQLDIGWGYVHTCIVGPEQPDFSSAPTD